MPQLLLKGSGLAAVLLPCAMPTYSVELTVHSNVMDVCCHLLKAGCFTSAPAFPKQHPSLPFPGTYAHALHQLSNPCCVNGHAMWQFFQSLAIIGLLCQRNLIGAHLQPLTAVGLCRGCADNNIMGCAAIPGHVANIGTVAKTKNHLGRKAPAGELPPSTVLLKSRHCIVVSQQM